MKDYNKQTRIRKIAESNEYLIETIESRLVPNKLVEVTIGKQTKRIHSHVER